MPALAADDVHVWLARLDLSGGPGSANFAVLSSVEQERARSMAAPPARRFVAARALLRRLLGAYIPCSPPQVEIELGPHGKPFLAGSHSNANIQFNLAHSTDLAAVAISRSPVGVDIEGLRDLSDPDALAARFFAPSELSILKRSPAQHQKQTFFSIWTCKEAYVKALGSGISHGLASFGVDINTRSDAVLIHSNGVHDPSWTLKQLDLGPNLAGAVAIQAPNCSVKCWHLCSPEEAPPTSEP